MNLLKSNNRILLIFLIAFFPCVLQVKGQNSVLSGKITDNKNTPLVAVSVFIKGTSLGTTTNAEGKYKLQLKAGHYDLAFSLIGFQTIIKPIDILPGQQNLDLMLSESTYGLGEVVVKAGRENPALRIMRNAIARREFYYNQVKAYRCQVYIKGIQKLRNAPKKFLGQDIEGQLKSMGLDSGKRGILYLSESVSKLALKKPGLQHEEIISSKVSGRNNSFSFNQATDLMLDFYQNRMEMKSISPYKFISPLSENAFSVYRFKLSGTSENAGRKIYRIQVIPSRKGANLFEGLIYIQDSSWNIQAADMQIAKGSQVDILDSLQIRQQYIEPRSGVYVLSTVEYRFSGSIFKFKFYGNYLETFSNYEIDPAFTKADFPSDVIHVSSASNMKDSTYWNTIRPVPLAQEEKTDYTRKDSIFKTHETKKYKDSVDQKRNKIKPLSILLTGQTFQNSYKKSYFSIAPLGFMLGYNTVEGLEISPQLYYTKRKTDTTSFTFGTNLRYGFVNRRFNPSANLSWNLNSLKHSVLSFSGGSKISDQNSMGGMDPLYNTYQTLFFKINQLKLYEKHFLEASYYHDLTRQVNLGASLEFANRIPLPNTAYAYISGNAQRHFTDNDPYSSMGNNLAFNINQALTFNVFAKINFGEKFIVRPDMIISQGSDYPTLYLNYRKGIHGILGSDADYNFLSARLTQRNIETGSVGKFNYSFSGGKFLSKKNLTYLDYQHFNSALSGFYPRAEAFEQLNTYRFSAADYYLHAHIEENFQGAILSRIPLIRNLKLEEIVGASLLRNDQLKNNEEVYLGFQRLGLRVSYTLSFIEGRKYLNGFSLTFGGF